MGRHCFRNFTQFSASLSCASPSDPSATGSKGRVGFVEVWGAQDCKTIKENKPVLVVTTRWVRTNKNNCLVGKDFLAKSRLVVQGFIYKALGHKRRDAPTASAVAESVCLAVCAYTRFTLLAKDIQIAYFSGKAVDREVYLAQPRGGLLGLQAGQESHLRFCRGCKDVLASAQGAPGVRRMG